MILNNKFRRVGDTGKGPKNERSSVSILTNNPPVFIVLIIFYDPAIFVNHL